MITEGTHEDMASIKKLNKSEGYHYFDPGTMEFFNCTTIDKVFAGRIFITSEQFTSRHGDGLPGWTIRCIGDDGGIYTVGEFQQYPTSGDAIERASDIEKIITTEGGYDEL